MVNTMDRMAKKWRTAAGMLLLISLVALFLPITNRVQENYATLQWSPYDYLEQMQQGNLPSGTENAVSLSGKQMAFLICFMMLPMLLALLAGIYGVIGSSRQIVSAILTFLVSGLFLLMVVLLPDLWPECSKGQSYERGVGCIWLLVFSFCSTAASLAALFATPKVTASGVDGIPQFVEMKQEKMIPKYSFVSDQESSKPTGTVSQSTVSHNVPGTPRGVLVGLSGIYAGAEIPFADGEKIRLGRLNNNDLIFEDQPKVSRNHCQIQWDAGRKKFSIRDYSSNGSFANGSEECLPQNIDLWLDPGTVLAIGDNTNCFRLE